MKIKNKNKIRIGVSSCLMGNQVRYDGVGKKYHYLHNTLSRFFDFVPFCPEVAIGMGIPRPPIHLIRVANGQGASSLRAVDTKDNSKDVTDKLRLYGEKTIKQIQPLSGFILKKDSPSCGMERVKTYTEQKQFMDREGIGVFANVLQQQLPDMPIEEEGRLNDLALRENFILRIYAYHHWQTLQKQRLTPQQLVQFHSDYKYLLMAYNPQQLKKLGQLVAEAGNRSIDAVSKEYISLFMQTLKKITTRGKHANVLQHLMGYLKNQIDSSDKQELLKVIRSYKQGYLPLSAPLTLMRHHFRKHPHSYISRQRYLFPYPTELAL